MRSSRYSLEKTSNLIGYWINVSLQNKMPRIEQDDARVRNVVAECLCSRRDEEQIVAPPARADGSSTAIVVCSGVNGALRPMKTGTIASPWRYDAMARYALERATLRRTAISHYASSQASGRARALTDR
jgi:hypothetical protein